MYITNIVTFNFCTAIKDLKDKTICEIHKRNNQVYFLRPLCMDN